MYVTWELIHYYPTVTTVDFPKRIKDLSTNAHKTYEQTIKAKEQGFDMLVGAGLRIALEWLVWDYLIKIKGYPESEVDKLTLAKRIEKMNSDFYTQVCTRLVRLFGNDIESGKNIPVQCISYVGYGWVALSTKRNEEVLVPLQSLQVHFEFVDISKRTPEYSFQIEEIDPRIQW